ncbi:hypothetical protein ACFE04_016763 [Oxalis oulophora]
MSCCFRPQQQKSTTPTMNSSFSYPAYPYEQQAPPMQFQQQPIYVRQEILLQIPGCTVHLMEEGQAIQLANGDFSLIKIVDNNVPLATIIKVGYDLQWPLTKDEPVVKLDSHQYLFTLLMKDGDPLSYGVTFLQQNGNSLERLDWFLKEHSCFSDSGSKRNNDIDWKEFAPKIEGYNNVLAKAIAGGTGQIVKGIFKLSNAYTNQVHRGGDMIVTQSTQPENSLVDAREKNGSSYKNTSSAGVNKSLKRVRQLSKTTEKISKTMLDFVGVASGSIMGPVVNSQAGKAFFSMVPGEVLLASLDAVNKILDAAEAAEKQALSATSKAASSAVSKRYGENAGAATEDAFATAGHCASTAWNVFKIRKAINPASSVSSGVLKNAATIRKNKY